VSAAKHSDCLNTVVATFSGFVTFLAALGYALAFTVAPDAINMALGASIWAILGWVAYAYLKLEKS
jgi:hypothetical protein